MGVDFILYLKTIFSFIMVEEFNKESICKDMNIGLPQSLLKVVYDSVGAVKPGQILTPTQVKNQPHFEWNADPNAYYTLVFHDPDNTRRSAPDLAEWNHCLIVNIKGNDVSTGEVLAPFVGSGPPENTGLHRYVFLIFKQKKYDKFEGTPRLKFTIDGRAHQKVRSLVDKYNLEGPVAGNFYQAEFDDFVPLLYKSLGAA